MTDSWKTASLGDVCGFEGGSQPPKSQFVHHEKPGYVRFLQIRDFGSDKNITYIPKSKKNRQCVENDILIGRYGASVGKILTNKAGAYNVALMKTIPNLEVLDRSWFYNYLISNEFQGHLLKVADRSAQAGFSKDDIYNFPVPVPPLPEQQRIVGILDEAFEGVATAKANAEKNLQNARALFESHLQSVYTQRGPGWVEKTLKEVCAITSTLVDPRKKEFLDLIHVGAGNIESKTGVFVDLQTAREEGLISGKFLFDESMVLYSKIRPYLMKVARPDFDGLCSADMYPLTPLPNEITRDYLFHLLLSRGFTDYAIQGSARAGMPKVNREHLFEFGVWLPDVKIQKELAAKLDSLHEETQRLESIYQRKLAALEALKKSLLHQAFTGQL
jgi:type I restriction enzyme S subunit